MMKRLFAIALALTLVCAAALAESGLTEFSTSDMQGNPVDQSVFADYDLTMVNIWTTWCGFCIQEMPELAELKKMLPENVNLITICEDADMEGDLAKEILSASGANFQTLKPSEEMYSQLLGEVYAFPTTYFLDSSGQPAADPLMGVPPSDNGVAEAYLSIIQGVLGTMEG